MNKNSQEDKIVTPINEVLAVLPDESTADEVMKDLRQAGFPDDALRLLREREASEKIVGAIGQNAGLATRIFKFFEQMHTDGAVYLEQYREAGRQGKEVLAVNFGTWEIKDLSLPRPEQAGRG